MKRVLLVIPVLMVLAVVIVAATRQSPGGGPPAAGGGLSAGQLPYPRTTSPLPVPEVHIGESPWRETLGGVPSTAAPMPRPTDGPIGCALQGEFRFCRGG